MSETCICELMETISRQAKEIDRLKEDGLKLRRSNLYWKRKTIKSMRWHVEYDFDGDKNGMQFQRAKLRILSALDKRIDALGGAK